MEGLLLSQENLQKLENYLSDQPYKFSQPILIFLSNIKIEEAQKIAKNSEKENEQT